MVYIYYVLYFEREKINFNCIFFLINIIVKEKVRFNSYEIVLENGWFIFYIFIRLF